MASAKESSKFSNYAESAFDKYDTNKTGYIEYSEFKKVMIWLVSLEKV